MLRIAGQGTSVVVEITRNTTLDEALNMAGLSYSPAIAYRTPTGMLTKNSTVPSEGVIVFAKAEANGFLHSL